MKTFMAKPSNIEREWKIVDADGKVLGRLATKIARVLMGKHKPTYTPHLDTGDFVVVLNCEKIQLSGKKRETKTYRYYTGWVGGLRERKLSDMMERDPAEVLRLAVQRMMPKSRLGRAQLKKLKIYAGGKHPHEAQNPQTLDLDRI